LFVINREHKLEDVKVLQQLSEGLCLNPNFYDISLSGDLCLFSQIQGRNRSLAEDLRGKTLVLIDTEFNLSVDPTKTLMASATDFVYRSDLLRLQREFDVKVVIWTSDYNRAQEQILW